MPENYRYRCRVGGLHKQRGLHFLDSRKKALDWRHLKWLPVYLDWLLSSKALEIKKQDCEWFHPKWYIFPNTPKMLCYRDRIKTPKASSFTKTLMVYTRNEELLTFLEALSRAYESCRECSSGSGDSGSPDWGEVGIAGDGDGDDCLGISASFRVTSTSSRGVVGPAEGS